MFEFTITPDGGEAFTVKCTSRDIVKWENAPGTKGRSVGTLVEQMRMSDLTDLAWFAADRAGLYDGDIKQFRASVDLEFKRKADDEDDEDEDSGPTRADR